MGIPDHFASTIVELHGEEGTQWLAELPTLLAACARRWSLTLSRPFEPLSYNYVAPAQRADGSDVVLKVGVPNPELKTEMEALQIFDGRGIVRLLEADWEWGALLLERLKPGTMLVTVEDDAEATRIAARVMQQLWQPAPAQHSFPSVAKWSRGLARLRKEFDGSSGPFEPSLVQAAEDYFANLLACSDEPVLLHGDLHHYNILSAERRPWLALDPKGVIGEPAYETGAFLRNPVPQIAGVHDLDKVLARRVDQFAEILNLDRQRILRWGLAQAVLSAWWTYEDHGYGWESAMTVAAALGRCQRQR